MPMKLELVPVGQPGMNVDGQHVVSLKTKAQLQQELALVNAGNYQVVTRQNANQTVVAPSDYMNYLKYQIKQIDAKQQAANAQKATQVDEKTKDALIMTLRQKLTTAETKLYTQDEIIDKLLKVAEQNERYIKQQNQSPLLAGDSLLLIQNRRVLVAIAQDVDDGVDMHTKVDRLLNVVVANAIYSRKDAKAFIDDQYEKTTFDRYMDVLSKTAISAKLAQLANDEPDANSNADATTSTSAAAVHADATAGTDDLPNDETENVK